MTTCTIERPETAGTTPVDDVTSFPSPKFRWGVAAKYYYDPAFKTEIRTEILALRKLQAGWDGERAPAINKRILLAALRFVEQLSEGIAPKPRVVPTLSGGLQLEWHEGRASLEFEFETFETVHYLQWNPVNRTEQEDYFSADDRTKAENLIRWFTTQNA